jgi:hypothetical protein
MDEITVGTVSWYSARFIARLIGNLTQKTRDSHLRFIVCDNTNGEDTELYDLLDDKCTVLPHRPDTSGIRKRGAAASVAHGQGLNFLFTQINTEYGLFLDPDCLILLEGWDLVSKHQIKGNSVAIGAPYHSSRVVNYQGFPSVIFVLFNTEAFRQMGADWRAYGISPVLRAVTWLWNTQLRYATGLVGRWIGPSFYASRFIGFLRHTPLCGQHRDTGWRIPQQARQHGYSATVFESAILPTQLHPCCRDLTGIAPLYRNHELFLWHGFPMVTHYYTTVRSKDKDDEAQRSDQWYSHASSVADQLDWDLWLSAASGDLATSEE